MAWIQGIENHYKDGFWKYPEFTRKRDVFLELLAAISDREYFGVPYDPSNALVAGDDPIALLQAVADRVVSMHASDWYLVPGTTLDELRQSDGTLGQTNGAWVVSSWKCRAESRQTTACGTLLAASPRLLVSSPRSQGRFSYRSLLPLQLPR